MFLLLDDVELGECLSEIARLRARGIRYLGRILFTENAAAV